MHDQGLSERYTATAAVLIVVNALSLKLLQFTRMEIATSFMCISTNSSNGPLLDACLCKFYYVIRE